MKTIYKDSRFRMVLSANILSSIGSGITMIAIPWLLVTTPNGNTLFGVVTLLSTVISFLLTPFIGTIIDKVSRKSVLMLGELISFLVVGFFAIIGFLGNSYSIWHYITIFFIAGLYYSFFYPSIFAFNQELFDQDDFKTLNGAMEIQGQLSSMIAGALASIILSKWSFQWILLVDALTYLAAFILINKISYQKRDREINKNSFFRNMSQGYTYIKKKPALFLFLIASFMPFIGVMLSNYLFPVYMTQVLKTDSSSYSLQSMVYGIGAMVAGFVIPLLTNKLGNKKTILITVSCYALFISLIIWIKLLPIFLIFTLFLAFGNAGTRVARNTFMMNQIPNNIIGRVDSIFRGLGLGIRIILLTLFTYFSSSNHVSFGFIILSSMLLISTFVLFITSRLLSNKEHMMVALKSSVHFK